MLEDFGRSCKAPEWHVKQKKKKNILTIYRYEREIGKRRIILRLPCNGYAYKCIE